MPSAATRKPDPRIPVIAEIVAIDPPSTVRHAFQRAGLGVDHVDPPAWVWTPKTLRELPLEQLQRIQRIMARSAHIEIPAAGE